MQYDVCDSHGFWIVSTELRENGRFASIQVAQRECDRRNYAAGVADLDGQSLIGPRWGTSFEIALFAQQHLSHPECRCLREAQEFGGANLRESEVAENHESNVSQSKCPAELQ